MPVVFWKEKRAKLLLALRLWTYVPMQGHWVIRHDDNVEEAKKLCILLRYSFNFLSLFPQSYFREHFLHILSADVVLRPQQPSKIVGQVKDEENAQNHGYSCTVWSNTYLVKNREERFWQTGFFFFFNDPISATETQL